MYFEIIQTLLYLFNIGNNKSIRDFLKRWRIKKKNSGLFYSSLFMWIMLFRLKINDLFLLFLNLTFSSNAWINNNSFFYPIHIRTYPSIRTPPPFCIFFFHTSFSFLRPLVYIKLTSHTYTHTHVIFLIMISSRFSFLIHDFLFSWLFYLRINKKVRWELNVQRKRLRGGR